MYIETPVGKLSKVQLNNLLKGKNVRIKKGTAHTINLSEEQSKKFHRNIRQGKALTIKLTQDQIAKQGGGILGDLIGLVHPTAGKVASMVGLGMKKRGRGIVSDLIGLVHPTAGKVASMVGLGMKKNGRGFLENMAKEAAINMAKAAGKFAIDKGADFAKGKIEGMGLKGVPATQKQLEALIKARAVRMDNLLAAGKKPQVKRTGPKRKATPAQLEALARGRAKRDANRRGGALMPAGY